MTVTDSIADRLSNQEFNIVRWLLCYLHCLCLSLCLTQLATAQRLVDSVEHQNWEEASRRVAGGEDIQQTQADGMTPLHWAVFHQRTELVQQLVRMKANVNAKTVYDVTPLSIACTQGNTGLTELLLTHGADVSAKQPGGEDPLMIAARTGVAGVVAALLNGGAKVDTQDGSGQTALMWAAAEGNTEAVGLLLGAGASYATKLDSGYTALMFAAREGRIETVKRLLFAGADVNQVMQPAKTAGRAPRKGMSALMLAVESGHFELAIELVRLGADPNDQRSEFAPLHAVTWVRKTNRGDDIYGDPPPRGSGRLTSLQFVRELVSAGADVNLQLEEGSGGRAKLNMLGATPFLLASKTADLPLLKTLLELGANPQLTNADGCTPLMATAGIGVTAVGEEAGTESEVLEVIDFLVDLGADPNAIDKNRETAMHGAAYRNYPRAVARLAEVGADPDIWNHKNKYGWTPTLIAAGNRPGSFKPSPETIAALATAMQPTKSTKPNIILVMADDQGWGETGYRQHLRLKTPHLDAMAEAGLRFDRFYAGGPVCSPTRASVLTGRSHNRAGVQTHGYALRLQEKTLAQALKAAGYRTGHFGKWHLNGFKGPGVPILESDDHHPGHFGFDEWLSVTNFFDRNPLLSRQGAIEEFAGDSSEIVIDEALKFIRAQAAAGLPSLSVVWFGSPHSPFVATEEDTLPFADLDAASRNHYGELVAMDRSIGNLRKSLREMGIEQNTLVWFCSDNGGLPNITPETVDGLRGFKGSVYEGGLRVPCIVEWPARIDPRITEFPAVVMDIFPTLAELVGLPIDSQLTPSDGISLVELFNAEIGQRSKPIPFNYSGETALIDNHWKLIRAGKTKSDGQHFELYDLSADPTEANNLYSAGLPEGQRLEKQLLKWEKSLAASVAGKDYPEGQVRAGEPKSTAWTEAKAYAPYLQEWKKRPEFQSTIKD